MKRLSLRLLLLSGGLLAILALAAAPRPAEAATTVVQVGQVNGGTANANRYNAASISVAPGDTVRWQRFSGNHNVTSAVVPAGEATFRFPATGSMVAATNYDLVVNTAGTYTYYCSIHANASDATLANIDGNISGNSLMVGKVVVQAASSASVANLALPAVAYSHSAQSSSGTMTVAATNGAATGFSVTILASAFAYSGPNAGTSIPAANFSITSAATPVMTAGQAVDGTGGPKVPTVSPVGTLDSARKTVQANAGFGVGTYTQALGVTLSIPAQSRAGTYTDTLTTTIAAAP